MGDWLRNEKKEWAYEDLHGFKPEVYVSMPPIRDLNKIKIVNNGKEVYIDEFLKRQFTDYVILTYNNEGRKFKTVYEAEIEANKILR